MRGIVILISNLFGQSWQENIPPSDHWDEQPGDAEAFSGFIIGAVVIGFLWFVFGKR